MSHNVCVYIHFKCRTLASMPTNLMSSQIAAIAAILALFAGSDTPTRTSVDAKFCVPFSKMSSPIPLFAPSRFSTENRCKIV